MTLRGARVARGPNEAVALDVEIAGGRIRALRKPSTRGPGIDLAGLLLLPGLINAHDHLEFNLYPRLGRGPYPNAGAWSGDVYRPAESPVREQLDIPKNTRLVWGGLKNLLSGATTVCHHNPRENPVFDRRFPVRVLKRFGWAHSLQFSPDVAARFHDTPADWPFILHLGEGVDRAARREVFRLDELGALDSRTVLVHAVALGPGGLRLVKQKGAALIWCPSSNLFMLGRTLDAALAKDIPVALGSDSAVTARGDLLDEIRVARKYLPVERIYRMVTDGAARILRLPRGYGAIEEGGPADLIAIAGDGRAPAEALARARKIELAVVAGKVKLSAREQPGLSPLRVRGRGDVFVDADVPRLRARVAGPLRLAGRRVLP
ncbi:MAG TPA: amidohydrolase family protein [Bryobacteraceae bacterium]|jgi:cytosine/adenosine deaminase-related metal-dependent hydrolase|nr:amidohydrolase family protein [Bryobacteraceae bacterium]